MTPALTAEPQRRALLRSALRHFGVAVVFALLLAGGLTAALDLGPAFVIKALICFAVGSLLFLPALLRDHPFSRLGPANRGTLARLLIIAVMAGFLGEEVGSPAALLLAGLGLIALLLDGIDGHLARRSGMASPFGARFDMETDAALILLLSILAWQLDKAGVWIVAAGLLRYLFVAATWVLPWMGAALPPRRRRQTVCVIQIAVLLAVLLPVVNPPLSSSLAAAALCLLGLSFLVDTLWLARTRALPGEPAASTPAKGS